MFEMIEIEVHSYCNRHCKWCPNSLKDRGHHLMTEEMYINLLVDLKKHDFKGKISYSRYNEPMADAIIYLRLAQAREILPDVILHMNTNGDFITNTTLNTLSAYLNTLSIQMYDIPNPRAPITRWNNRWRTMEVEMRWPSLIVNRMQIIEPYQREVPCDIPKQNCYIDWDGSVMPCCNMRSDFHPEFVLGNIRSKSIFKIWPMKKDLDITKEPCVSCCYGATQS